MRGHLEKTLLLSIGHVAVLVASFAVPLFLSRWLSVEDYGTYKQLMMLFVLAMAVGHLGMDNGLFYFIKTHPGKEGVFSLNVVAFDGLIAILFALACLLFQRPLAAAFNNPELVRYLPAFCLMTVLSIPTQHFEHYLTVLDDIRGAVWLAVVYEMAKALAIVGGFYFLHSLNAVLVALSLLAGVKLVWLVWFNLRRVNRRSVTLRESQDFLIEQVRFSMPQGVTNLIASALKLDKFVISGMFSVRRFTLYAVGCFDVPLIGSVSNTMTDLMSFDMVTARREGDVATIQGLWHGTIRKVAFFQIPIVIFFFWFSTPLIVFLFSETYRESAEYFRVYTLVLLVAAFAPDILFRVFAETKRLLKIQLGAAACTLLAVLGGAWAFGPMGALLGKLLADGVTLLRTSQEAGRMLGLTSRYYLPWGPLGGVFLVSLGAGGLALLLTAPLQSRPFFQLAVGFALYAGTGTAIAVATRLVPIEEARDLAARATKLIGWSPLPIRR